MTTNTPPQDLLESDERSTLEVTLQMTFRAENVIDAIDRFVDDAAHRGFDDFTYSVRNTETHEAWVVQQGQIYTVADFLALVGGDEQADSEVQSG